MILVNGHPGASVDALDRGLHYGDGLFETIAVVDGEPLLWQRHMGRLAEGCHRLGLPFPDAEQLRAEVALAGVGVSRAVTKVIITRGAGGRGYRATASLLPTRLVMSFPWPDHPDDYQRIGVNVRLCRTRLSRNTATAGIKHLNRLEQVLARSEWDGEEFAEGLMLDTAGELVEGTMSNLFLVEGAKVVTPELHECGIAGVMRAQIMDCAGRLDISIRVESVSPKRAEEADALFLSNSVIGLWPVRRFEGRSYSVSPLVQRLQQELRQDHACA